MDYEVMLDFHKENHADVTIATMPVPIEEASRFGIVIADEKQKDRRLRRKAKGATQQPGIHGYLYL